MKTFLNPIDFRLLRTENQTVLIRSDRSDGEKSPYEEHMPAFNIFSKVIVYYSQDGATKAVLYGSYNDFAEDRQNYVDARSSSSITKLEVYIAVTHIDNSEEEISLVEAEAEFGENPKAEATLEEARFLFVGAGNYLNIYTGSGLEAAREAFPDYEALLPPLVGAHVEHDGLHI